MLLEQRSRPVRRHETAGDRWAANSFKVAQIAAAQDKRRRQRLVRDLMQIAVRYDHLDADVAALARAWARETGGGGGR